LEKKKIMIVDDSEILCESMKAKIEGNGPFEVRIETASKLAVAAAKNYGPDLIIIDIMMPEVDGVSLSIFLKNDIVTAEIPVMFLTAIAQEGDFAFGDVFGGYQVLPKDVPTDRLIKCIHQNVNRKQ